MSKVVDSLPKLLAHLIQGLPTQVIYHVVQVAA